ncbi:histidine phosphatase family protein [Trebonia sp.]|uniref:histidine phosphatase family protein n=1 Tax=Trebonia sp. TaxID=2767075 RepID=UPI002619FABF|nr:histidine phosphatase family protein [Trebonia sp.]
MAVITSLLLTRHGEAHCNVAGVAGGEKTCTGLTERGRTQVRLLAERLCAEAPADVLYAAPRRRVQESAQILSQTLGLRLHIEPGLSGPDHGEADGRPWDEIKAAFGGPAQSDPDRPYAPGSETWNHYLARAGATLSRLIRRHEGQRILIAGHGETVDAAATLLLGLSSGSSTRVGFESAHASITCWNMQRNRFGQEVWILAALNDTGHLASAP